MEILYKDIDRLLEDIFAPMSSPEQKNVEKKLDIMFKTTLNVGLDDSIRRKGMWIKLIEMLAAEGFKSDHRGEGTTWYKSGLKNPKNKDLAYIKDRIKKKVWEFTGEVPKDHYYPGGIDDIYTIGITSDVVSPEIGIVLHKIRKAISEDIFKPMSDPEQEIVDSQMTYVDNIAINIPAANNLSKEQMSSFHDKLLANGFREAGYLNRNFWYDKREKIESKKQPFGQQGYVQNYYESKRQTQLKYIKFITDILEGIGVDIKSSDIFGVVVSGDKGSTIIYLNVSREKIKK